MNKKKKKPQEQLKQKQKELNSRMQLQATLIASTTTIMIVSILLVQLVLSAQAAAASASSSAQADLQQHQLHRQAQSSNHHHHQQQRHHQSAAHQSYDEEINFEPQYDYDKTSAIARATNYSDRSSSSSSSPQIGPNEPASLAYSDQAAAQQSSISSTNFATNENDAGNDPFAATFEEYLKEASSNLALNHMGDDSSSLIASNFDDDDSNNNNNNNSSSRAHSNTLSREPENMLQDSSDSASIKQRETPIIDYIFPPSTSSGQQQQRETRKSETNESGQSRQNDGGNNNDAKNSLASSNKSAAISSDDGLLLNEIKLLFAWRQLPTSKCSKPCGKGFQINHLSCVDMKYEVRVEDELCLKSSVPKPKEFSDEPCNEIDCPPEWISIIEQPLSNEQKNNVACTNNNNNNNNNTQTSDGKPEQSDTCRPTASSGGGAVYKRVQCAMLDRTGATVYLDDQKCSAAAAGQNNHQHSQHSQHHHHQPEAHVAPIKSNYDDESVELAELDMTISGDENYNRIVANNHESSSLPDGSFTPLEKTPLPPHNEPFLEAGPWSTCFGDKCAQLGKRYRKLTCRIYLSRSARFTELPESSCQGAAQPDTQEPCYIDCEGGQFQISNMTELDGSRSLSHEHANQIAVVEQSSSSSSSSQGNDNNDQIEMISVISGIHIEQRANHVLVLDSQNGRKELISNEQLLGMPLKVLSKIMAGFPREVLSRVKQLRRTLRTQRVGLAAICRATGSGSSQPTAAAAALKDQRRLEHRSKLERRNAELVEELRQKETRIAELEKRILSCEFDNSILAA